MRSTRAAGPAATHTGSSALEDAAALGPPAMAAIRVASGDGLCLIDADRRYVYANPAACQTLGHPLERLRGRDLLDSFPAREHATMLAHLAQQLGGAATRFACAVLGPGGAEHEIDCSTFAIDISGRLHSVIILRDRTGHQTVARTATALAHTAAQLAGTSTTDEILRGIARDGAEDTRALACGIVVVGDDGRLVAGGAFGFPAPGMRAWTAGSVTLEDLGERPGAVEGLPGASTIGRAVNGHRGQGARTADPHQPCSVTTKSTSSPETISPVPR